MARPTWSRSRYQFGNIVGLAAAAGATVATEVMPNKPGVGVGVGVEIGVGVGTN